MFCFALFYLPCHIYLIFCVWKKKHKKLCVTFCNSKLLESLLVKNTKFWISFRKSKVKTIGKLIFFPMFDCALFYSEVWFGKKWTFEVIMEVTKDFSAFWGSAIQEDHSENSEKKAYFQFRFRGFKRKSIKHWF